MQLDDYDFKLPPERIAQFPASDRENSRLMILDRQERSIQAGEFPQVLDCFKPGDLLVLNDTRVIPARLHGSKESGGRIEVFLVRRLAGEAEVWACLTKCSRAPRAGSTVQLDGGIEGIVLAGGNPPFKHISFSCRGDFLQLVEQVGRMPLPPYIRREDEAVDRDRYQTVFASAPGALAAPTAGLHFTERILDELRYRGVGIHPMTLHVGLGTFLPVRCDNIREHRMHEEAYHIPAETATAVNAAKREGRRVFALGTTTTRTLEFAVDEDGRLQAGEGVTDLFIYPGFRFRIVDALITNFHLPRSTLLMLVSAFAGREFTLHGYQQAVEQGFRFFSYGDCMVIL